MKKLIAIVVMMLSLTGCEGERDRRAANPVIFPAGTYDGCEVKYVDKGYMKDSFYIARCSNTTSTTGFYETGGKSSQTIPIATIVHKEDSITQQDLLLDKKIKVLKSALNQFSPEEKKLLGLTGSN